MKRDEKLKKMLEHHTKMVEKLRMVDLRKLSNKQLDAFEKALEHLDNYALVHVKINKR